MKAMSMSALTCGVKSLSATTAVVCAAMVASIAAQADIYNYSYTRTLSNTYFTGTFEATITGIGSNISSSSPIAINSANGVFNGGPSGGSLPITGISGYLDLSNSLALFRANISSNDIRSGAGADNFVTGTSSSFSFGDALFGLFSAVNAGPAGGGGGSGGAPSPEVNAFLGLALVGGTVALLRRKRVGHLEAKAA